MPSVFKKINDKFLLIYSCNNSSAIDIPAEYDDIEEVAFNINPTSSPFIFISHVPALRKISIVSCYKRAVLVFDPRTLYNVTYLKISSDAHVTIRNIDLLPLNIRLLTLTSIELKSPRHVKVLEYSYHHDCSAWTVQTLILMTNTSHDTKLLPVNTKRLMCRGPLAISYMSVIPKFDIKAIIMHMTSLKAIDRIVEHHVNQRNDEELNSFIKNNNVIIVDYI